jgi:hypothetical protein
MHQKRKPPKCRERVDKPPPRSEQEISAAEALVFLAACNSPNKSNEACIKSFGEEESNKMDEELFSLEDSQVKGLAISLFI